MAFDENLARRLRQYLRQLENGHEFEIAEKHMFGGLAFMVNGHMCCGVEKANLMVRVGPSEYETALANPHARPMDFTGRPLRGFVYVAAEGYASEHDLASWVDLGLQFVGTLPPK